MITIETLNFSYGKNRPLFKNMDMQLHNAHIYGLLGKNGAGKSTLLKNIAGLVYPQSGHISVLGHDPSKREVSLLQDICFIPEEFHLPSVKSEKYIKTTAGFYPNFDRAYFEELIREFDIPDQQKLSDMSYGQKKKYIIAFGLATKTKLVIMDEPTNGLDIPSKTQFRKIMASTIDEERCVIISTHQVRDLDNLIDAVIVLDEYKIALNASIFELADRLMFKKVSVLSPEVLYAEQTMGGYSAILPNTTGEQSKVD
ncbi:MAG: ABC transporter ATP-binding protein, partial [Sphingobacterium sp.]